MLRTLTRLQLGTDLAIAGVFAVVFVAIAAGTTSYAVMGYGVQSVTPLGLFLYPVLFAVALGLRRLSPSLALGAAWAGAIAQMAAALPPGWADAAVCAVLFATAAYGDRRTYWAGLASAVVGAVVVAVYLSGMLIGGMLTLGSAVAVTAILLAALLALLLSWTAGALARSRLQGLDTRRAVVAAEAEAAALGERERIARDMHDVVAHSLAVVIAQADGARYAATSDPDAATAALSTISATARAALADVRLLLIQLRHRQGDGPQPTLADLEALYDQSRAAGVTVDVTVDPSPPGVPPAGVQLAVYRILQEALTNALRHGGGSPVAVRLGWHADRVELEVRNRVPVGAVARGSGHGLVGMGERAQLAGGTVTAAARDGDFVVAARLPIGAAA